MLEEYIEVVKPEVIKLFENESSGHDLGHLTRTMKLALKICESENGDRLVIGLAAFMHDVHRLMENQENRRVVPKESIPIIRQILDKTDLEESIKDKICFAIENHELYNWNGENVDDINTLILQDADNLEAIGAIGIGRSFQYSGAHNMLMYTEDYPLNESDDFKEETGNDPSVIHHYYHKLFKLAKNMNTKTARKMADDRIEFMRNFTNEFLEEWNGQK